MPSIRRSTLLVALLSAAVLVTAMAPAASASLPHARKYHGHGPITLDTNLLSASGLSAWAIDEYLKANTPLPKLGAAFLKAEREYGVNARFLLAAALHESGWGKSAIARVKHNLFGYNAYDRDPMRYASAYKTFAANIRDVARFMKETYLSPTGRWWSGRPTLRAMQQYWSSSGSWGERVSRISKSLRLSSLRARRIRIEAPALPATLHVDDKISVQLAWSGGAIPSAIGFKAAWVPIAVDTPPVAEGAAEASTTPALTPVDANAREGRSAGHRITLSVRTPATPGTYNLVVTMLDAGGQALPATDRVSVPVATAHVWADRAIDYRVTTTADRAGVRLQVTNTGRDAIPAEPAWGASAPQDPEVQAARSLISVTATSTDPATPAPVVLLAVPLAEDLEPGATLDFEIPRIEEATGRRANVLSIDLRVLDQPAWLDRYSPVAIRRSGERLGKPVLELAALAPIVVAGEGGQWEASMPLVAPKPVPKTAAAPVVTPAPAPTPGPATTPEPAVTPTPVVTPTPMPSIAPVVTPKPTPKPKPTATPAATPKPLAMAAPVVRPTPVAPPTPASAATPKPVARHVTRAYSEDSSAVRLRGRWGSASGSGYLGGGVAWSTTAGATATLTFTGTSIQWIGPKGPTRGRALVLVDGRAVTTVNMHSTSFDARAVLFRRSFKHAGKHTVTIRVLSSPGHPYVAIDGFVVRT